MAANLTRIPDINVESLINIFSDKLKLMENNIHEHKQQLKNLINNLESRYGAQNSEAYATTKCATQIPIINKNVENNKNSLPCAQKLIPLNERLNNDSEDVTTDNDDDNYTLVTSRKSKKVKYSYHHLRHLLFQKKLKCLERPQHRN